MLCVFKKKFEEWKHISEFVSVSHLKYYVHNQGKKRVHIFFFQEN